MYRTIKDFDFSKMKYWLCTGRRELLPFLTLKELFMLAVTDKKWYLKLGIKEVKTDIILLTLFYLPAFCILCYLLAFCFKVLWDNVFFTSVWS